MKQYIATFRTHLSALLTSRALVEVGVKARMAPVPRALSSSCGTCVYYEAKDLRIDCLDRDAEAVYSGSYELLWENGES